MQFLPNILPLVSDRWQITNGSMALGYIVLFRGGMASVKLTPDDIAYIPKAFQIRIVHNLSSAVTWKNSDVVAELYIAYEDGEFLRTMVPLNSEQFTNNRRITINVCVVPSKKFKTLTFSVTHKTSFPVQLTLQSCELMPSLDLDDGLQLNLEAMLPQLVYKYNDAPIIAPMGIDTSVIQLPVAVNKDANLMLSAHLTGTCSDDTIECSVKIDGEMVKAFPVKQSFIAGQFFFGIPSLITYVKEGAHVVQLSIKTLTGAVSIAKEFAVLALEGRSIIGGAESSFPHAEVYQTIPLFDFYNVLKYQSESIAEFITPTMHSANDFIPLSMRNISTETKILFVQYGINYSFTNPYNETPLSPVPDLIYTDIAGTKATMNITFKGTITNYEEYGLCETIVDNTPFDPIYSTVIQEVIQ